MFYKHWKIGIAVMLIAASTGAAPMSAIAQPAPPPYWGPPGISPQSEERAHPRIVWAIRQLQVVYRDLQAAPDNFGGNKAQAMADVVQAIHSLKRALYYRLRMDDQALDQLLN